MSDSQMLFVMTALCFLSRIGDVLTTKLATRSLHAEANLIVRKFGWTYAYITILIGFLPLLDLTLGTAVTVLSLLVSFSNGAKVLLLRLIGDREYMQLLQNHLNEKGFFKTAALIGLPVIFSSLLSCVIFLALDGMSLTSIQEGLLLGFVMFSVVASIHYSSFLFRLRAKSKSSAYC